MSNLYSERLIAVNLEADSKDSAIEQLICMLDKENRINLVLKTFVENGAKENIYFLNP